MSSTPRYLSAPIRETLGKKMVFLGGPRQVGKTTLSFGLLGTKANESHPGYLNWDDPRVPPRLRLGEIPANQKLLVFDEIHKYAKWRNLIKGIYDTHKSELSILVTGSARLDYYRKGGDSLANRYRYFRLHPFSFGELHSNPNRSDLEALLKFGGFPEPLFAQSDKELRIWHRDRMTRVIREDLRDLEYVREISLIEQLVDALPMRVGSPLSIANLRGDLGVDHKTVDRWIHILENLYVCFRVAPFGAPKIRAVKKEQKLYLWDWSVIEDPGARFENLVASQLLKYCHFIEDTEGFRMELRYIRDTDKREVDFVVLKDGKPEFAVESKLGERAITPAMNYFSEKTRVPKFFQVHMGTDEYVKGKVTVCPFHVMVKQLNLP